MRLSNKTGLKHSQATNKTVTPTALPQPTLQNLLKAKTLTIGMTMTANWGI